MNASLEVVSLKKYFKAGGDLRTGRQKYIHAVDDVSFAVAKGETLSIVGESGCGKTTLGRTILRLVEPTSGEIWVGGSRIDTLSKSQLRKVRRHLQVVFQDLAASFNPRMSIRDIVAEPLINFDIASSRAERDDRVVELLDKVRLPHDLMSRFPHELSGGQRQRIGIARALAPNPQVIICDEAVSALDASVKAQIVNLLCDLQEAFQMALLFISHDLAIVENLTHRVAVMYLGQIVEVADRETFFTNARHPYSRALLSAAPIPDPDAKRRPLILSGDIPSPISPPNGCRFHTRCPYVFDHCRIDAPELRERGDNGHYAACHLDALPSAM